MAVGDGGNDLAMLSGVTAAGGLGVAMANAVPAVRRVLWQCLEFRCQGLELPKLPCNAHREFLFAEAHAIHIFPLVMQINS